MVVVDLADPEVVRWPAYGPAMLGHEIRGVYAMPVVVAGEYVGALDLFRAHPGPLPGDELAGAVAAAEHAGCRFWISRAESAGRRGSSR